MKLAPRGRAIAIMYHDVVASGDLTSSGFSGAGADIYKLDRAEFIGHLAGMSFSPSVVDNHGTVSAPAGARAPVFLTFDDGGVSAYTETAPILEGRGWRGLFFVTTDRIGSPGFLSAQQIRELVARGHVVGSHSCSHPRRISACSAAELRHEWGDSVDALQELLGAPVATASVPGGFYSPAVGRSAAEAGIATLFTSEPTTRIGQVDGCLLVGRYGVWRGMPISTTGRIAAGALLPRWRQSAWWSLKKAAKALPGDPYAKLRRVLLARRA
jgi:peptidoglycan/xylan/chitin deacetylase (PgdA/CDA1 family)